MTQGKAKAYINAGGRSLDIVAKEMSDHYGIEIEPTDLVDFMDKFPNGEKQALKESDSQAAIDAVIQALS